MTFIALGVLAYALMFLYDINGAKANIPALRPLFALGVALLGFASGAIVYASLGHAYAATPIFAVLALVFLALTVYSLFFALPPKSTYIDGRPKLCTTGMYALCRHPGVLWLSLMYASLWAALPCGLTLLGGAVFSALDIFYALFQDMWTFPRMFSDYGKYKKEVPFLLPNPASIRRALSGRAA